ncbi:MAG: hypothetical protein J1E62_09000 [Lachnospiraceae bacterium]|nr:hypothetical protein [Lachnospiraceae bacterium]
MKKKLLCMTLVFALLTVSISIPDVTNWVAAAGTSYMKALGVNWDLKNNASVSFTEYYIGIGDQNYTAKITNYKLADAKKSGYKQLTFDLTIQSNWSPSQSQINKMVNTMNEKNVDSVGEGYYYTVVDYNTGTNLEKKNNYNVTVKKPKADVKQEEHTAAIGNTDWTIGLVKSAKSKGVTVTFPEDYDGVSIVVGGGNALNSGAYNDLKQKDDSFWDGKTAFGETSYYKKGKKNSHWMRVLTLEQYLFDKFGYQG